MLSYSSKESASGNREKKSYHQAQLKMKKSQ